jgi:hypothetical protein
MGSHWTHSSLGLQFFPGSALTADFGLTRPSQSHEPIPENESLNSWLMMDGWMGGRTDDGWMDGWMDEWTDGRMDGWTNGWMDGRMDGWTDGWMNGQMDGRMDG